MRPGALPVQPGIRGVLTDIEGTTTPIAFVYETLFPFARARLEAYCRRAGEDPRIAEALSVLRAEYDEEARAGSAGLQPFDGATYAQRLMAQDRKSTGLKALQGIIWEEGYRQGALTAQVFPDVPSALERWHDAGIRLRVFSSGSVLAQRLLFAHTDQGNLTRFFEGYHDTTTGPKQRPESYSAIRDAFELPAQQLLYLSDVVQELDAARAAGLFTGLLIRPGNPPQPASEHPVHRHFDALLP